MEDTAETTTPPVAVDKAAEAREARRRRILENSSKRLEKITGRSAEEFEKGEYFSRFRNKSHKSSIHALAEKERDQTIYPDPDEEPILSEPSPLRPQSHDMANLFAGFDGGPAGGGQGGMPSMMGDQDMAQFMQTLLSSGMGGGGGAGLGMSFGGGPPGAQPQEEVPEHMIVKLIRTRIPIVIVALGVFLVFHTQQSHLLSGNVLLSLLLWETVELFLLKHFRQLNARRSKLTIVLSLFNVAPQTVDKCLTMLGMVYKIIQDFSVFMFAFVLLNHFFGRGSSTV